MYAGSSTELVVRNCLPKSTFSVLNSDCKSAEAVSKNLLTAIYSASVVIDASYGPNFAESWDNLSHGSAYSSITIE